MLMITKYLYIFLLSCAIFTSYSFAQDIGAVSAQFCNGWKFTDYLNFTTDSAKSNPICVQFTNQSSQDVAIKIWFPDGTITKDQFKDRACKTESSINNFGQYVKQANKTLIVPAQKTITYQASIQFPAWFGWIVHGCLTYTIADTDSSNMVNIVMRKTRYIDILVWSNFKRDISLQNFSKNQSIQTQSNFDSTFSIKLNFINSWDINEFFQWSGIIYDKFWFFKIFDIPPNKITPNSQQQLDINIWRLPFYWWIFQIQISWNIQPEILFNQDNLDPRLKQTILVQSQNTFTIIPRKIILSILIIALIIFSINYYKKKSHHK